MDKFLYAGREWCDVTSFKRIVVETVIKSRKDLSHKVNSYHGKQTNPAGEDNKGWREDM